MKKLDNRYLNISNDKTLKEFSFKVLFMFGFIFFNLVSTSFLCCRLIKLGTVIAATTPRIDNVISTSAKVNAKIFLNFIFNLFKCFSFRCIFCFLFTTFFTCFSSCYRVKWRFQICKLFFSWHSVFANITYCTSTST